MQADCFCTSSPHQQLIALLLITIEHLFTSPSLLFSWCTEMAELAFITRLAPFGARKGAWLAMPGEVTYGANGRKL